LQTVYDARAAARSPLVRASSLVRAIISRLREATSSADEMFKVLRLQQSLAAFCLSCEPSKGHAQNTYGHAQWDQVSAPRAVARRGTAHQTQNYAKLVICGWPGVLLLRRGNSRLPLRWIRFIVVGCHRRMRGSRETARAYRRVRCRHRCANCRRTCPAENGSDRFPDNCTNCITRVPSDSRSLPARPKRTRLCRGSRSDHRVQIRRR
jgi:hypothetical protein